MRISIFFSEHNSLLAQPQLLVDYLLKSTIDTEANVEIELSVETYSKTKINHRDDRETATEYGNNDGTTKTNYGDNKDNLNFEVASNNTLLPGPRSAKNPVQEDTASMVEFDMMLSSPPANPAASTIDQGFLTSAVNWEHRSTRDICARMPEVDRIRPVINKQFGFKARPWQVSVLIDIT